MNPADYHFPTPLYACQALSVWSSGECRRRVFFNPRDLPEIRTRTVRILSALPLPVGLEGLCLPRDISLRRLLTPNVKQSTPNGYR